MWVSLCAWIYSCTSSCCFRIVSLSLKSWPMETVATFLCSHMEEDFVPWPSHLWPNANTTSWLYTCCHMIWDENLHVCCYIKLFTLSLLNILPMSARVMPVDCLIPYPITSAISIETVLQQCVWYIVIVILLYIMSDHLFSYDYHMTYYGCSCYCSIHYVTSMLSSLTGF